MCWKTFNLLKNKYMITTRFSNELIFSMTDKHHQVLFWSFISLGGRQRCCPSPLLRLQSKALWPLVCERSFHGSEASKHAPRLKTNPLRESCSWLLAFQSVCVLQHSRWLRSWRQKGEVQVCQDVGLHPVYNQCCVCKDLWVPAS